jgi:tetratricopeptide (TPR) repeat protein
VDRLRQLLAFHADDPNDAFTIFALALEYRKRGDTAAAVGHFEQLMRDHPRYVGTYYHLGKLYEDLARPDDAVTTYEAGVKIAEAARDLHARAELQAALMEARDHADDDSW